MSMRMSSGETRMVTGSIASRRRRRRRNRPGSIVRARAHEAVRHSIGLGLALQMLGFLVLVTAIVDFAFHFFISGYWLGLVVGFAATATAAALYLMIYEATDARRWLVGAGAENQTLMELRGLRGWHCIHAVPFGSLFDVDHV